MLTLPVTVAAGLSRAASANGDTAAAGAPVANLSAVPADGTAPLKVDFNGMTSSDPNGNIASWTLSFGDGSAAQKGRGAISALIAHTYRKSGFFTALLTTTGTDGQVGKADFAVTVNAPPPPQKPVAALSASRGSGEAPFSVSFDGAKSVDPQNAFRSWVVSFGDNSAVVTGAGAPPKSLAHTYTAAGLYTATLTVTDSAGLAGTASAQVVVAAAARAGVDSEAPGASTAQLAVSPGSGAEPLAVSFDGALSADPDATIVSWSLSFGDKSAKLTGSGPPPAAIAHTYTAVGTYTGTLTVTDSNKQTSQAVARVTAQPAAPVATLNVTTPSSATGIHKIKHVIIIMQENRSFDDYFGTYPGADGIPMSNGVPTVCVPDPEAGTCIKPYHDTADVNIGGSHDVSNSLADIDGGKMDGFIGQAENEAPGACRPTTPDCAPGPGGYTDVMGYHTAAEIPNYWSYAEHFVLNDHMFETNQGYSLPSHLGLVSLWAAACSKAGDPQSCVSNLNQPIQATNRDWPWTDLTWLLHRSGVSWQYFVGTGGDPDCQNDGANCEATQLSPVQPGIWNPLPYFDDVKQDGQLGNIVATADFYPEARNGTLPAVSWVVPAAAVSDHPPSLVSAGQAYVTGLINAVMEGPDWDSTAIFLTWDDWGGFYDNVVPPAVDGLGYGLRVPGLIISPYADAGKIDHQTLSFDAYAKFIEDDFLNGQRLDPATDGRPDPRPDVREDAPQLGNLTSDFNFNQTPLAPLVLNSGPPWGTAPNPTREPAPTGGTAPLTVNLDGSQSSDQGGTIASWTLDFGDGTPGASGTGPPPAISHTYQNAGNYTATLTVVNQANLSDSTTATVMVQLAPPVPTLTASPPGGLAPVTASFDASATTTPGSTIASWSLSFGDGSPQLTGTGTPPDPIATHTYPMAGDYGLTLTINAANGTTATAPFTYIVNPSLTLTPNPTAPGTTVEVTGAGYQPSETVNITLNGQPWGTATANSTGAYQSAALPVPTNLATGNQTVTALGETSGITTSQTLSLYANWQFRNSPSGGSVQPYETTIGTNNVANLVAAPWWGTTGAPINSSPAAYNGLIFVGSNDGYLYEWSTVTYREQHTLPTGGTIVSSPALTSTDVFVGSENGDLYGFRNDCEPGDEHNCQPTLTVATGGPIMSSPVVAGKSIYVGSSDGKLYAVSPSGSGKVLWSTALSGPVTSSPAVDGSTVVVGAGNDVYALNTATGAIKWTATTGAAVTSSPAIVNNTVYIGSQDDNLYAFPLNCSATCTPTWTATTGGPIQSSPAVANGTIYIGSGDNNLYAFNLSGTQQWTMTTGGPVNSSPTVANGVVYVGSNDDNIYAANAAGCGAATCSPLWSSPTNGPITTQPAIANGQLYVSSTDDHLYIYTLPTN